MKLITRAQWGARDYKRPNGATPYSRARRGVKLHYLGTAYTDRSHTQCAGYVRQLQAQHMDGNGWSDIGYSFVVCTHGYVYEGRGLARRNSANGNTALNEQDYAVCLLVGSSGLVEAPAVQLHGARDAIDYCRKEGPAGDWLGGHRDGYATECPGDVIYAWVKKGAPRPDSSKEVDMSDKDAVYDAVWDQDKAPAPSMSSTLDTNRFWKPISFLRETYDAVIRLHRDVNALRAEVAELIKKGN
ncbi:peptidoglycan recognition protein family protein [Streptomyces scabiei]|uniref:peptidoglycan recognition protein family protein n=1 Tax=Streptomyces scabiei TaxID=1930 RepID=UPI001B305F22|nr:peptidoglycan recognition family protein [Streptomyces sp. LBUM 1475]QTU64209.1 N-acetylmuramoyl-L-alanine amidase [Streptomyces sp. LBUM 1475]